MGQEELNSLRIGNVLKSIRIEKDIPIKKVADILNVSESSISQIETGKNYASIDRCKQIFLIYDCPFDFDIDFNVIKEKFFSFFDNYSQLNNLNILNQMESFFKNEKYFYSFGRFEYALILYLYSIVSEKIFLIEKYDLNKIIECGFSCLDIKEQSIYYDLKGNYYFWKNNIKVAEKCTLKSLELDPFNFMANYHFGILNLREGYFSVALIYLDAATNGAIYLGAFERLLYITLCKSVILVYTYQYDEAIHLCSNLLNESKKRIDNTRLEKSIKSCIALNYLIQRDFEKTLWWIDDINSKYLGEREMLYKVYSLFKLKKYEQCKFFIKVFNDKLKKSRHGKEFLSGINNMMKNKIDKAISCFEICYKLSSDNGEMDKAILDLGLLESLYYEHKYFDKLQRVHFIFNEFYKISHSRTEIKNIDIKLRLN